MKSLSILRCIYGSVGILIGFIARLQGTKMTEVDDIVDCTRPHVDVALWRSRLRARDVLPLCAHRASLADRPNRQPKRHVSSALVRQSTGFERERMYPSHTIESRH
jgi:hypothetical protein